MNGKTDNRGGNRAETAPGEGAAAPFRKPKSARRRSREYALQGLYQWLLSGDTDEANAAAIDSHIRETTGFDKADAGHFSSLLHETIRNAAVHRAAIAPHLDRPIAELSPVEHAILLIGTEELTNHPEIPYKVVINEAVEVAKSFGGTDGFRYVNGVLDKIAAARRETEVTAQK